MTARADAIDVFDVATSWFLDVVTGIAPAAWAAPGLGVWNVRELVGHSARAMVTVEQYLTLPDHVTDGEPPAAPDDADGEAATARAASYFVGLRGNTALHDDVAERGRQAGAQLPAEAGAVLAALEAQTARVLAALRAAPAGAYFRTRFGSVPFTAYLRTRTVELAVHTVDLVRACGGEPEMPAPVASSVVAVLGELAVQRGSGFELIAAVSGRVALDPAFGVFR